MRAIQDEFGYLPDEALRRLAAETNTPLYRLQELASFFPHFRQEWNKPPRVQVQVCRDMACHRRGSRKLMEQLKPLAKDGEHGVSIEGVSCLGRCDRAPALFISRHDGDHETDFHDHLYANRPPEEIESLLRAIIAGGESKPDTDAAYGVSRKGWLIDPYADQKFEPYAAVRKLVLESVPVPPSGAAAPHPWIKLLEKAGLAGMGGAGMPAYLKWQEVWKATPEDGKPEKYIVVNGDESEPSTFKDREILLQMPHLVVEAVILAGILTNATAAYIFIRHEYGEQIRSVRAAIKEALQLNVCGDAILGTNRKFTVEVFESPGGYICGEQSALIEAMEDRRAQPRNKPPELMTNGLRDRPTVVNNVETMAWTPAIFLNHETWYSQGWREGFGGRRFFSLCGDVAKPGVFEVPIGITLGELIDDYAGGMRDGLPLKAVALSGPSGGLIPAMVPVRIGVEKRIKSQTDRIERLCNDKIKGFQASLQARNNLADLLAGIERIPPGSVEPLLDLLKAAAEKAGKDGLEKKFLDESLKTAPVLAAKGAEAFRSELTIAIKRRAGERDVNMDEEQFRKSEAAARAEATREREKFDKLVNGVLVDNAFFDARKLPLDKGALTTLTNVAERDFMLGAGLAVFSEGTDAFDAAVRMSEFFRNESCGKCVPCRIGSQKITEIGQDLLARRDRRERIPLEEIDSIRQNVFDLHSAISTTSICGLGQVAGSPMVTALTYFSDALVPADPKE